MNPVFKGLLESLKPKLQEGALTQDNDHQYTLRLEGYLVMVDLLPDEEKILLATSLGALPKDNLCELYQTMLQGQYFYQQTSGAVLAVDNSASFAVLQAILPLPLTDESVLLRAIEGFLHKADLWREKLGTFSASAQSPGQPGTSSLMFATSLLA